LCKYKPKNLYTLRLNSVLYRAYYKLRKFWLFTFLLHPHRHIWIPQNACRTFEALGLWENTGCSASVQYAAQQYLCSHDSKQAL